MRNLLVVVILAQLFISFMTWFLTTSFAIGRFLGQVIALGFKLLVRLLKWLWRTVPVWFRKLPPVR